MASNDIFYALEEILHFLTSAEMTFDTLLSLIGMIISLGQLVISVVGWGVAIISAVMSVVLGIVLFIVKAIPVFALAKKNGRKLAWLAWIPFFTDYLQTFVLMDTPGNAPFKLFKGKLNLEKRWIAFCIWLGICLLGGSIVSALNTAISSVLVAIPVLGPAVAVLVRFVLGYVVVAAAGIWFPAGCAECLQCRQEEQPDRFCRHHCAGRTGYRRLGKNHLVVSAAEEEAPACAGSGSGSCRLIIMHEGHPQGCPFLFAEQCPSEKDGGGGTGKNLCEFLENAVFRRKSG